MSFLGVLLLVLILLGVSLILLTSQLSYYISSYISKQDTPTPYLLNLQKLLVSLQKESFRHYTGYIIFMISLWNFFAPDFGSLYGGLTLIGALIPSLVLFLDSFILTPQLIEWIPIPIIREKISLIIEKFTSLAGWVTLFVAILHAVLYRLPLL